MAKLNERIMKDLTEQLNAEIERCEVILKNAAKRALPHSIFFELKEDVEYSKHASKNQNSKAMIRLLKKLKGYE